MNVEQQMNESVDVELRNEVATVWMDTPQRSVNVLDASMLHGLGLAVSWLERQLEKQPVACVVFRSRKNDCFFVGADVSAIGTLNCSEEAMRVLMLGQELFQRIEDLKVPTLAAINGACMGGGLELALSCEYRVALQSPKTRFALPEIKLGLIPGWGGTQRLPRQVGLRAALKMILTGGSLRAEEALDALLIDRSLPMEYWELFFEAERLRRFCEDQSGMREHVKSCRSLKERLTTWALEETRLGRWAVLRLASRKIASRKQHYPALAKAIDAIGAGLRSSDGVSGFHQERSAFVRLLFTNTAQNLLNLFLSRDKAKKASTWTQGKQPLDAPKASPADFSSAAVIGAGAMGAGIGTLIATKGSRVVFKELNEEACETGKHRVVELLDRQVRKGRLSTRVMKDVLSRIEFTCNWQDVSECDLAIEAVVEVEAVKRQVFEMLDQHLPEHALICSNTSSLSVTRMAAQIKRKSRVAGLHFFNPVHRMDLVEVVRTESTSEEALRSLLQFVKAIGKTPVVTSDKPGFLVNRALFPYLGEAVRMVAEGWEVEEIDRQMRRFGMPMGPLELIDQVGVDIAHHVAKTLVDILPEAQMPADYLGTMVEAGWIGRKAGIGFYVYDHAQPVHVNKGLNQEATAPNVELPFKPDSLTYLQRRLIYPLLNESVHCLDEMVVTEPWMVDLGLVLGTGFAPHQGGPLSLVDYVGSCTVLHNLQVLQRYCGSRFEPADGFQRVLQQDEPFFAKDRRVLTWENDHEPRYSTQL